MQTKWPKVVLAVAIAVYLVYAFSAPYTLANAPPIPNAVLTKDNKIIFTNEDIVHGKYPFQKYGLMDYGSVLGMGGYFGVDFTSYTLEIIKESIATSYGIANISMANSSATSQIKTDIQPFYNPETNIITITEGFLEGFNQSVLFYQDYFGPRASEVGLRKNLITNSTEIDQISSFFAWSGIVSLLGYTNGFPFIPGIQEPSNNVTFASVLQMTALLLAIMPAVAYVTIKLLSHWKEKTLSIELPNVTMAQKTALFGVIFAAIAIGIQGLLGAYTMHLYGSSSFYGLDLTSILPFNVTRASHYTLAILWIVITWVSFSLFVLPYFGLKLSRRKTASILSIALVVGLGALLGIYLSYQQYIPSPWWFIIGSQGRDIAVPGTFWLISIGLLLSYVTYLFARAYRTAPEGLKLFPAVLSIALGGTAVGTFIGALPVVAPFSNFSVDEFFRWTFIHSYVEGFWPVIVVSILTTLLVLMGLIPLKLATAIVGLDATLEITTGMIGTAHHFYWGGQPVVWTYVGAALSTLEVIPMGFLLVYSLLLLRKRRTTSPLQKTVAVSVAVAGVVGGLGAVGLGGGLINLPYINYFLHDLQTTMAHAHLTFPLAYGLPSILMWVVAMFLAGYLTQKDMKLMRRAAVIIGVGFLLQSFITLLPLGIEQMNFMMIHGYWASKSIYTPSGNMGFWQLAPAPTLIWIRMVGDLTAAAGIGIAAFLIILRWTSRFTKSRNSAQEA